MPEAKNCKKYFFKKANKKLDIARSISYIRSVRNVPRETKWCGFFATQVNPTRHKMKTLHFTPAQTLLEVQS